MKADNEAKKAAAADAQLQVSVKDRVRQVEADAITEASKADSDAKAAADAQLQVGPTGHYGFRVPGRGRRLRSLERRLNKVSTEIDGSVIGVKIEPNSVVGVKIESISVVGDLTLMNLSDADRMPLHSDAYSNANEENNDFNPFNLGTKPGDDDDDFCSITGDSFVAEVMGANS